LSIRGRVVISLAFGLFLANILLVFLGQNDIAVYYIANSILFFIITLAFSNLSSRSKTALQYMSLFVFAGFIYFAVLKISAMIA
jgi:hypothetical protein